MIKKPLGKSFLIHAVSIAFILAFIASLIVYFAEQPNDYTDEVIGYDTEYLDVEDSNIESTIEKISSEIAATNSDGDDYDEEDSALDNGDTIVEKEEFNSPVVSDNDGTIVIDRTIFIGSIFLVLAVGIEIVYFASSRNGNKNIKAAIVGLFLLGGTVGLISLGSTPFVSAEGDSTPVTTDPPIQEDDSGGEGTTDGVESNPGDGTPVEGDGAAPIPDPDNPPATDNPTQTTDEEDTSESKKPWELVSCKIITINASTGEDGKEDCLKLKKCTYNKDKFKEEYCSLRYRNVDSQSLRGLYLDPKAAIKTELEWDYFVNLDTKNKADAPTRIEVITQVYKIAKANGLDGTAVEYKNPITEKMANLALSKNNKKVTTQKWQIDGEKDEDTKAAAKWALMNQIYSGCKYYEEKESAGAIWNKIRKDGEGSKTYKKWLVNDNDSVIQLCWKTKATRAWTMNIIKNYLVNYVNRKVTTDYGVDDKTAICGYGAKENSSGNVSKTTNKVSVGIKNLPDPPLKKDVKQPVVMVIAATAWLGKDVLQNTSVNTRYSIACMEEPGTKKDGSKVSRIFKKPSEKLLPSNYLAQSDLKNSMKNLKTATKQLIATRKAAAKAAAEAKAKEEAEKNSQSDSGNGSGSGSGNSGGNNSSDSNSGNTGNNNSNNDGAGYHDADKLIQEAKDATTRARIAAATAKNAADRVNNGCDATGTSTVSEAEIVRRQTTARVNARQAITAAREAEEAASKIAPGGIKSLANATAEQARTAAEYALEQANRGTGGGSVCKPSTPVKI